MITSTHLKAFEETIQDASLVNRSVSGRKGVYFFISPKGAETILKMESDAVKHLLADQYFQALGFETPKYRAISRKTPEGEAISTRFGELIQKYFDLEKNNSNYHTDKGIFDHHFAHCDYFLTMNYIDATPFSDLMRIDLANDFQDPEILMNLGEVMFLDAAIGNHDRLTPEGCNLGNIMRKMDKQQRGRKVALIDHDFHFSTKSLTQCQEHINSLFDGDRAKETIEALLAELNIDDSSLEEYTEKMLPPIKAGICLAAEAFVKKFTDESAIEEILTLSGFEERSITDILPFMELVTHTKKILERQMESVALTTEKKQSEEMSEQHFQQERWENSLKALIRHIQTSNEDQRKTFIPYYSAKSGLETDTLFRMLKMREELAENPNPELYTEFKALHLDVLAYFQKKLEQAQQNDEENI